MNSFVSSFQIGFRNAGTMKSSRAGCELCCHLLFPFNKLNELNATRLINNNDTGKFVLEMTYFYQNQGKSRCPRVVKHVNHQFRNVVLQNGEHLAHYANPPSCDETNDFQNK